jgi:putative membrane protein
MNAGRLSLTLGVTSLLAAWLGPLPELSRSYFSAHMAVHIIVVAVAAPLVAVGLAGSRFDPARMAPALFAPVPASIVELLVVWGWHAPALHAAARADAGMFALEQATFLAAGLLLWISAVSTWSSWRRWAGAGALLFTTIHMTLLGALFTLATRPLYLHHTGTSRLSPLLDQQVGGAIMLIVGGASYLIGALWLLAGGLESHRVRDMRGIRL